MRGVLLHNNLKGLVAALTNVDCGATGGGAIAITSSGYNLSHDTSCGLSDTTDIEGVDALLVALADNGGSTLTHALPANSMAVNNGGILGATTVDQRGVTRDSTPDIGAYEFVAPAVPGSSDSKNIFGCTVGKPSGFDPTFLFVVIISLLYLTRRKLKEAEIQE
ncbi:MAG: hypothetical protein KAU29_02260 [Gammaproteobacteria bacterium]|nr:hypothetical protein [Gammaproteobacteria bacterium]